MDEMRKAYNILVGTPKGNRSFGRRSCRLNDIKMAHREIMGFEVVDWIHLAQVRDQWQTVV
jgi:hypothetical protein